MTPPATIICDNVYQLLIAWGLHATGALPERVGTVVSIGSRLLMQRSANVAAAMGATAIHVACGDDPLAQLACAARLRLSTSGALSEAIRAAGRLTVFNDVHPVTVGLCRYRQGAVVSLVEEGVGVHRHRHIGWLSPMRWLGTALVPGLNVSGRMGEAAWVDELWVSDASTLSANQQRKRIRVISSAAMIDEIRRRWPSASGLPDDPRPLLLFLGQPFVEDGVIGRREFDDMLQAIANAIPQSSRRRMLCAYKPHPRERDGQAAAARLFGDEAVLLDGNVPIEAIDLRERDIFLAAFTSGGLRNLTDARRRISVASCFPRLLSEIGDRGIFPNVTFLTSLDQLPIELDHFLDA